MNKLILSQFLRLCNKNELTKIFRLDKVYTFKFDQLTILWQDKVNEDKKYNNYYSILHYHTHLTWCLLYLFKKSENFIRVE